MNGEYLELSSPGRQCGRPAVIPCQHCVDSELLLGPLICWLLQPSLYTCHCNTKTVIDNMGINGLVF